MDHLQTAAGQSGDAHIWSDLAAAYLARAGEQDEARDLLRALAAADQAVNLAPALPEARFNYALAVDHLFLRNVARSSWAFYRRLDPNSPWRQEAMQRRAMLGRPAAAEEWERNRPALARAARQGDRRTVKALVAANRQAARERGMEEYLGAWSESVLSGREREGAEALRTADALGEALFELGGDQSLHGSVRAIKAALDLGDRDELLRLARGHQALDEGGSSFQRLAFEDAAPGLGRARAELARTGSPAALWAEVGLAGLDLYTVRYDQASRGFQELMRHSDPRRFPALWGRGRWGLGLTRIRQGRLADALAQYREAARHFALAGETENLCAVEALTAETLRFLGQDDAAWAYRHRALRGLFLYPASRRLHNLLWETAEAALDVGEPGVALVLQDEGVGVAERSGDPLMLAEALIRRSRVRHAAGQIEGARRDLEEAAGQNRLGRGDRTRGRIALDIAFARGEILGRTDPARSLPLLGQAIEGYTARGLPLLLAAALVSRARAYLALAAEAQARQDLEAAAGLFERQQATLRDDALRLSYSETAQALFDEMIRLERRRGSPIESLAVAERARAAILGKSPRFRPQALSRLPETLVLVEYALIRDRLLVWIVRRGGVELVDRGVNPVEVAELIRRFAHAVRSGSPREELTAASSPLFGLLIPPQVRDSSSDLLLIPDKVLNEVPFAALVDPRSGRYLIERRAVGIVPSLGFYLQARTSARARRERGGGPALLVGDPVFDRNLFPAFPRLAGAQAEVEAVRPLFPGAEILMGKAATRERFLADLARYEVLHYAGHAVYNPRRPTDSYLLLAPSAGGSGILFARELEGLQLPRLRLVVLSACDTVRGSPARSGNLTGLVRPFLSAGAAAVLGSLWQVDDRAVVLLTSFHRRRLATGSALQALREAQLEMLASRDPSLSAPANWSAFQLVGSGE